MYKEKVTPKSLSLMILRLKKQLILWSVSLESICNELNKEKQNTHFFSFYKPIIKMEPSNSEDKPVLHYSFSTTLNGEWKKHPTLSFLPSWYAHQIPSISWLPRWQITKRPPHSTWNVRLLSERRRKRLSTTNQCRALQSCKYMIYLSSIP